MGNNEKESLQRFDEIIKDIQSKIKNEIENSFDKRFSKNITNYNYNSIEKWKKHILEYLKKEIQNLNFQQKSNEIDIKENKNKIVRNFSIEIIDKKDFNKNENINNKEIDKNKINNKEYKIESIKFEEFNRNEKLNNKEFNEKKNINIDENENRNLKEVNKIENNKLDYFTSKEIQEQNKVITRDFQKEAYNHINYNEKYENQNIASFFYEVAKISRNAYNEAYNLLNYMLKYHKSNSNKIIITSLDDDDIQYKKEFSSWVKNMDEKEKSKILNQLFGNYKGNSFLYYLYIQLTIMYFHCHISFPSVTISFKAENNFNPEKMIDFINRGQGRKVNFVILPSLFANGNYLQNGKSWVFTFNKNKFKFKDSELEGLKIEEYEINIPNPINELKVDINYKKINNDIYAFAKTNFEISKNIKCTYIFILRNNVGKEKKETVYQNFIKLPNNYNIKKFTLKIGNFEFSIEYN